MIENKRIKRWGFLFSLFVLFLAMPLNVKAATSLSLTGDSSVSPGSTVSYNVVLNVDDEATFVIGFSAEVTYDSKVLTLSSITPGTNWTGTTTSVSSGKEITFTNETGISGETVVATLVFKVNSSVTATTASISLSNCNYSNSNNDLKQISGSVTKTLSIKSSDNTLKSLKVNGVSVDDFSADVYEYDVTVTSKTETAKILAKTNSTKASLKTGSGNRTVNLNYGSNVVLVIVVSESGVEQTYTLNIVREDTRSTDTTLSSITIDGEAISDFKSSIYKYTIKKYKAESVAIVATPNDSNATVVVTPPSEMIIGENTYTITVTSENGATAIYTVIINNIDTTISKKLKTLSIHGYSIDFDNNNNRYEIMYNKSKFKNLHIYFTTVADSDEVTAVLSPDINNDAESLAALRPGDEITITVTGIDGESVEYTIAVVKDNRISFFLVLELFIIVVIVVIIFVVHRRRKKGKKKPKKEKKDKKEKIEVEEEKPKKDKPKKKRFSIYEDEYEEVEVEVDDDSDIPTDEYVATKELTDEELNLK